jgi:hypothetical protein
LEIKINKLIMKKDWTVKELIKELTENYNDNDVIVIESTDTKTGDTQDLHRFYIDEIDGLIMGDGTVVSELRLTMIHEL